MMFGCMAFLFWLVIGVLAVGFVPLQEHRDWAIIIFVLAWLLTIASVEWAEGER